MNKQINKIDNENKDIETRERATLQYYTEKLDSNAPLNNLNFIDGVLVACKIFDMILKERLPDVNGISGIRKDIDDDITNRIFIKILFDYYESRQDQLIHQFGLDI